MRPIYDQIILAIYPFEDLSLKHDLDIFCRSFSADLVTELSRFRQFQIISLPARPAAGPQTTETSILTVKTDYFIQGTFRGDNKTIRINVQLYNSETQHLVWGSRLEGKLTDLHEIQDSLLLQVIGALQQQIKSDLVSGIRKRARVEFKAYEHWLYGIEEIKKGSVENDLKAREHFKMALEIQPDYSLGCSGMSLTYFNEWSCQLWDRWDACKSGAYEWAQKAIELDDQNYIASMVLGKILLYDEAYETAEYYLRRSLMLNANDPETVIQIAGYFTFLGLHDEAVKLYERTLQLNPSNSSAYYGLGSFIFFEAGDFEKAASLSVDLQNRNWADADAYCAAIYYYLKNYDKMRFYWNKYLDNYRRLISKGKAFSPQDAIEWLPKINPHKSKTNLEGFLKFIGDGAFEATVARRSVAGKEASVENYFRKEQAAWKLSFEGTVVQVPEVKGFNDIRKLLAQPGQVFHCAELMGSSVFQHGEKLFDGKARREYEKKILELQADIREAEFHNNFARLEKLQDEYDRLIEYLSESLQLNGKARESGSTVEKARSAVTWRIRNAIARIERHHAVLGIYLSNSIKTGTLCSYQPDRDFTWITS
jgi:TolB-like protein